MRLVLSLVMMLWWLNSGAQTLVLNNETKLSDSFLDANQNVLHYACIEDLSPQQLFELYQNKQFSLPPKKGVNHGYTDQFHYLAVEIENQLKHQQTLYLVIKNSAINVVEYSRFCADSLFVSKKFGDYYRFDERPEHFFLYTIPLEATPSQKTIYFLKLDKRKENLFIMWNLFTPSAYNHFTSTIFSTFGVFAGIILAMVIINLLSFATFRDSIHLWYIVYALANLFVILSFEGIDFQLFYPNHPFFSNVSRYFATAIQLSLATIVFRRFVGYRIFDWSNLTQKTLTITLIIHALSLPIGWFIFSHTDELEQFKSGYLRVFTASNLAAMTCIIIGSIQRYRSGVKHALFFVAAISIVFLGGLEYSLVVNGALSRSLLIPSVIPNTLAYGMMIETIVVSAGIVYRYHRIKQENENLQGQFHKQQLQLNIAATTYRTEERVRIARNIHDEIASRLFGARMYLEALRNKLPEFHLNQEIGQASKAIEEAEIKTREVIDDLQETDMITISEFMSTLLVTVQELSQQAYFPVQFENIDLPFNAAVSKRVTHQSSLILRELLTNAQKHSNPELELVQISASQSHIYITITDQGLIKNPLPFVHGNGLKSIHSRLLEINGTINFQFNKALVTAIQFPIDGSVLEK
jgi:signal transduction histidine kinase